MQNFLYVYQWSAIMQHKLHTIQNKKMSCGNKKVLNLVLVDEIISNESTVSELFLPDITLNNFLTYLPTNCKFTVHFALFKKIRILYSLLKKRWKNHVKGASKIYALAFR